MIRSLIPTDYLFLFPFANLSTPPPPVSIYQCTLFHADFYLDPQRSTLIHSMYILLRVSYPSTPFASLWLTYLMPHFTYCSGSWTPDPSLICLVVDRP